MTDNKLIHALEKLHQFLHGAHLATPDIDAAETFHHACHKIEDIIKDIKNHD